MPAPRKRAHEPAKKPVKRAATKAASKTSGRSQTTGKAQGDAPVFAYIARLPGEQKAIASQVDGIVARSVPGVKRALKWNVPFYGVEGNGWFCAFAAFKHHASVNFFRGDALSPVPPVGGVKENRRVAYEKLADVDAAQLASWVRQAAAIPGWLAPRPRGGT